MVTSKSEQTDTLIGVRLGDYVIQSMIGRGGMARVYEGFDEKLNRRAAVKVIEAEHGAGDEMTDRFIREARAVANLDHPNIVGVYQFGETPHLYYLAMKLVEGETLQAILRKKRKQRKFLGSDEIVKIISETAAAIDYAHKQGVIHRDIKPSNIICSRDDRTILTDFGLLMQLDGDSTLGTAFGTPRYIAPEQAISSHRSVPQSDIYSLGIVLYEMLTGQTPFDNDSPMSLALSHISSQPPSLRTFRNDVPPFVELVVLKALEKRPENRWQTATKMADALRAAYEGFDPQVVLTQEPLDVPLPGQAPAASADGSRSIEAAVPSPIDRAPDQPDYSVLAQDKEAPRKARLLLPVVMLLSAVIVGAAGLYALSATSLNLPTAPPTQTIGPRIRLIYNKDLFIIYNPTGRTVSLEGIAFHRDEANGHLYKASAFGANTHKSFRAGGCLGMQRVGGSGNSLPIVCSADTDPLNFDDTNVFWAPKSDSDTVTRFVVQKGSQVLQTCWMHLDTCEFELP